MFYIFAAENACSSKGNFTPRSIFQEAWQYGSNLGEVDEDICIEQDGVAPQCAVDGLEINIGNEYGRAFIPNSVETKGFLGSHLMGNYGWALDNSNPNRPGYIDEKP